MDFAFTDRCNEYRERLLAFMDEWVYPNEQVYEEQIAEAGDPHHQPEVMEEMKAEAKARGLWNLFHPHAEWGPGLTNLEYAPLAEIMGRSPIASEACNCSAPDTGNMEVLTMFGTPEQQDMWLRPLLDGEIRSAFAMTEPDVASSDATNIALRIERDGDDYVLNGRKWWISGAMHPNCQIFIVMGKTDPTAPPHRQQSQILVPMDTPGLTIVRALPVFGYMDQEGHVELRVRPTCGCRSTNLIAGEGDGFAISQARLGPGRIHHCMRSIGAAERALELMCQRALVAHDVRHADRRAVEHHGLDRRGPDRARDGAAADAEDGVDDGHRRQQGGARSRSRRSRSPRRTWRCGSSTGRSRCTAPAACRDDFPLARMYAHLRTLRLADGPDEVHKMTIARRELRRHDPEFRVG